MRTAAVVFAIGLAAALLPGPQVASQDKPAPAKSEWTDLFAKQFKDWARDGLGKSPWRMTADGTLLCAPAEDGLGPDRDFKDGTLKFEYRFTPVAGAAKAKYKAAVVIRAKDSDSWCRLALGDDCGNLTAAFVAGSDKPKTIDVPGPAGLARAPGEWNQVKVNLKGKAVEVFVNGKLATAFVQAEAGQTRVMFETDGSQIEFRHVLWKDAK
jgi:Domain of Unknown Function (DUF1080)